MKKELSIFILLSVTLSCHGLLEKLLDPLNLSGAILKGISHAHKNSEAQISADGQYSSAYGGSSSASHSYGASNGENINGYKVPPQSNGYGGQPQHNVEIPQDNNFRQPLQGNGYDSSLHEGSFGNYQQSNGFVEKEGYHSNGGNLGLTFNINLGGLFGLGHSKHPHHGHKHHHFQGTDSGQFYPNTIPNENINGQGQNYNQDAVFSRPEHIGYQNSNDQYFNGNTGYNRPEHNMNQNEANLHETTYVHPPEGIDYNSGENENTSEWYNDNLQQNPVQNDRNGVPDEVNDQSEDKYVSSEPNVDKSTEIIYVSTTESSKIPSEDEKNTKVTTSNRKTTIRPDNDQPLLVPLNPNEYVYEGDKIQVASPKRNVEESTKKEEKNAKEEDFDIDVRFNDDA